MQDFVLKLGEKLMIDGIEVMVVRVQEDRVRLGISAPPEVPVHRREVYLQLLREKWPEGPAADGPAPVADRDSRTSGKGDDSGPGGGDKPDESSLGTSAPAQPNKPKEQK